MEKGHIKEPVDLPALIAVVWKAYQEEPPSFRKLLRLVDAYEAILKYCAILAIQNFSRASLAEAFPEVGRLIRERIQRPALGHWAELFREVIRCFDGRPTHLFCPPLASLQRQRAFNDACGKLNRLRNEYVGHGATLSDEEGALKAQEHERDLQTLVRLVAFLADFPLLYVQEQRGDRDYSVHPLMGADYGQAPHQSLQIPVGHLPLPVGHVVVQDPQANEYLDLHPLVLYAECTETIGGRVCRSWKVMFFNELREDQRRIAFLDYWQGHHSRFRPPHPLPDQFRQQFPRPERPPGKADWFEAFIQEQTAYFVGRRREQGDIQRFAEESPRRVLVVVGAPGMGKSALLARWAEEHQALRHFLREGDALTYEPVHLFENLALQLSEKFGVAWQAPDRPDPAAFRAAFEETLRNAAAKGPVVLVLDGLDEAVRAQSRGRGMESVATLLDWLPEPAFLPEGVRWILSTRPELLEHGAFRAKFGRDKAAHLELGRMSDEEVRALLYQVRSKYEVLGREDYVQAVVQRSEGNPLYLRMLLEDIAEGRITFGEVEQLPRGVIAYFARILDFIEGEGRTREMPNVEALLEAKREILEALVAQGILTPEQMQAHLERERKALEGRAGVKSVELLALYCLAKEPIAVEQAASILQADGEDAHRAFEVIRTVLVGDGAGRFAPFHSAFRDYFLNLEEYTEDRLPRHAATIDRVRGKLLDYCARWQEHESPYALRHYAEHLREGKESGKLFELARDEEFAKAQTKVLPQEPDLPLKTLQLALEAAIEEENPQLMAEMVLRHARKVEEGETPTEALRRGGWERAIGLARQRMERDYKVGTLWLLLLAVEGEARGDREAAKRCLNEIQRWLEGKALERLEEHQSEIAASLLSQLGGVQGAGGVAVLVLGDESRKELSVEWAKRGRFEEAERVAKRIKDARKRSMALEEIGKAMGEAGKLEQAVKVFGEAVKVAESIEDAWNRSEALTEIAEAMGKAGSVEEAMKVFEEAVRLAERIGNPQWRSMPLGEIAEMMAQVGMFEEAVRVAERIGDPRRRSKALGEIAKAMAEVGKFEDALKVAEGIEDVQKRSARLGQIMATAGSLGNAVWVAESIEARWRSEALREIAKAMAEAGMSEEAVTVAAGIEDAGRRSVGLREIATAMARAGRVEEAKKVFQEGVKVAEQIKDAWHRSTALEEIATAMAEAGRFEEARKVAERIEIAGRRSEALRGIATAMAKAGRVEEPKKVFEEAVRVAERIGDPRWRSEALTGIATAMAKAGRVEEPWKVFEEAVRVAERIGNPQWRSKALGKIAEMMVQVGMFEEAVSVAEGIEGAWRRSEALREIAKAMAAAGRVEEAVRVGERIEDAAWGSGALKGIAKAMAEAGLFEEAVGVAEGIEGAILLP
jgi:tetratricopeptide (TPR) repeat protein